MFDYPVTLTADGDNVLVTFADVPEAVTFGADEEDALLQAVDALETGLPFYVDARKPSPVPSKSRRGQKTVRPGALEGAKMGLHQAMTEQGIRKAELARRLGWHDASSFASAQSNVASSRWPALRAISGARQSEKPRVGFSGRTPRPFP